VLIFFLKAKGPFFFYANVLENGVIGMKPIVFNENINEMKKIIQKELETGHRKELFLTQISHCFTSSYMYFRWSEEENKIHICCHKKDYKDDLFDKIYDEIHDENPIIIGMIFLKEEIDIEIYDSTEVEDFEKVRLRILFE
jgi:hypothetical protein